MRALDVNQWQPDRRVDGGVHWRTDLAAGAWDAALAEFGGHPLQSALWGDARRAVDGIKDYRWMAVRGEEPLLMMRFEERRVPLFGNIAWVPRGPIGNPSAPGWPACRQESVISELRRRGVALLVTDEWRRRDNGPGEAGSRSPGPRTSWIDTSVGIKHVWLRLDARFRQAIRRGKRSGIVAEATGAAPDVSAFYHLCERVSRVKGFRLPSSLPLMQWILERGQQGPIESRLFIVRQAGTVAAGAFVLRCGRSLHFFWGGVDRRWSKERVGEAVQWAAIQWALETECRVYDLEGMDERIAPGVYAFKRKMGGEEVMLAGKLYYPLDWRGRMLARFDAKFR